MAARPAPKAARGVDGVSAHEPPKPRLLFVYEPTDGRARKLDGYLAQVLQRRGNHKSVQLCRVDATRYPQFLERLRLAATPALVVVEQNKIKAKLERPGGLGVIEELLRPWLH